MRWDALGLPPKVELKIYNIYMYHIFSANPIHNVQLIVLFVYVELFGAPKT